jgi:hypothetical protein
MGVSGSGIQRHIPPIPTQQTVGVSVLKKYIGRFERYLSVS